ncbi:MAG: transcription-repair-coupling factor [Phycisphaerae bacterium]|nr:MAG: transcription-repair-coupling factor [Phycisphaerae bacterium]
MPIDLLTLLQESPSITALADALALRRRAVATGLVGSAGVLVAGALARRLARPVIVVTAHLDDADEAADELAPSGLPIHRFPALEALPGESAVAADLFAERLTIARAASTIAGPAIVLCPIQALMQSVPAPSAMDMLIRRVEKGRDLRLLDLTQWLLSAGYARVDAVQEVGDFAQRGGILDVFPPGGAGVPLRLDFFGDTIDRLAEIDPDSMASDREIPAADLPAADPARLRPDDRGVSFLELLPRDAVVLLFETMEIVEQGRGYYERLSESKGIFGPPAVLQALESRFHALAEVNQFSAGAAAADVRLDLPASPLPAFPHDAAEAVGELASLASQEHTHVTVCCQNDGERQRLAELLDQFAPGHAGRITGVVAYLHRGFTWRGDPSPVHLVPYHELLSRFTVRRRATRLKAGRAMDTFLDFEDGDYVVHADHGIARYAGLHLMTPRDVPAYAAPGIRRAPPEPEEYLTLEFAGNAKLHVPATQIDKVQKYVGGFHGKPPLSVLGGQKWKNQKDRVAESVRDLAAELMRVRAAREHLPGVAFPADTPWQREFEAEFPYDETEDQLAALAEIKKDMSRPRPMDRLICGDVGFGKTELAIRAAFKCVESGRQAAVLVPTTVLCEQHERTFKSRFAGYPFRIESISRFKTDAEVRAVLEALKKGHVDLIIGTHRLLGQDVHFADLGLVVVDEEQRFGVEHKEALLRLRLTVDVLTLSATPIPRTLHMAMLGIRDISSLTTAPLDRRAIVTEVIPYNALRVRQAIQRELAREGQVFYVHNRVHDIQSKADDVRRLVPDARVVFGHGQMAPHELEEVMLRFIRREADILVATTIIESGIDIPTANTMIIDDADRFGLADLHQLRGRVGRSKHRAYCYLLLPDDRIVKEVAQKRLKAIEQYSMLGAGFKIAMRDLEIRGAGNILGPEQSGHIAAVGYEMYCQLLESAVRTLANEHAPPAPTGTTIEIGVSALIPKAYIPSDARRLEAYRRLASAADPDALARVRADLHDAYGQPPKPAHRLLDLAEIRIALAGQGVRTLTIRERDLVFLVERTDPVAALLRRHAPRGDESVVALPPKPGERLAEVYFRPPANALAEPDTLLAILRRRLGLTAEPPATPASSIPASTSGRTLPPKGMTRRRRNT